MGFSTRVFILDEVDRLHRLPSRWFSRMLREPPSRPVPLFAGQRVRFADAIVELIDRKPVHVVHMVCGYLKFDQHGVLDYKDFSKREAAKFNAFFDALLRDNDPSRSIVEAAERFTAAGGIWTPSSRLDAAICAAALGQSRCSRL
jgi:hypothetical protein